MILLAFLPIHKQTVFRKWDGNYMNEADNWEEQEEADEADDEEQQEEVSSELSDFEAGSRQSTPATTASSGTVATATSWISDDDGIDWAHDPDLELGTLEELRGCFGSELETPSAWVLQRLAVLTNAGSAFGPREAVRLWYEYVAQLTRTPAGEPLRLPPVARPENTPFQKAVVWEEANLLVGEARESCFGKDVDEEYKWIARVSIDFLVPGARAWGLSAGDKKRIFTVASAVWMHDRLKVCCGLEKEEAPGPEWAND
jgi:hypothetical protein